jgi:2-polyprenyl-3-methyl-5-hydroxy-6-metoxy-1,4-benzoquinol methylase
VVEHPDEAAALGRAAALSVRETGSMARTAQFIRTRVEEALVGIREVPAPAEPRTSRAERAIKSARRAVKAPADRRRTAFLAGYDERQRGRFLAVLHALGSVRRRTDRALRVAQENRRELRRIGAQVENLAGLTSSSQATAALAVRLGEELKLLHERLLVEAQVTAETGAHLRAVDTRLTGMAEDLGRLGDYVRVFSGDVETSLEEVRRQLAELSTADPAAVIHALLRDVQRLDAEQAARPYSSDGTGLRRSDETGARYLGFTESSEVPAFSDLFRGSEEFLVERMRAYMPLLADRGPVLDVGCGRGELLRLLAEAGVPARGVDHDEAAVARALAHGVDASVGDAVAAVTGAQPGSVGAVISTQVVEHLSGDELRALLLAGQRALRPGGLLIAETVNPHSPAALKTFWLDLTHVRPLYPEALLLLARDCGYRSARIVFAFGTGDLDTDLRTCGEYALVAAR